MDLEKLTFLIDAIRQSRTLRQKFAHRSHALFFLMYFSEYVTHPTADFQREMFKLSEAKDNDLCVISAFRGSGKSTVFSTSLPIWKIISGQSHFVVIASQTQHQARQHMYNIKKPLETNRLLRNDLGPFEAENNEWGFTSGLIFKEYDAKIMVVSTEQAIRGLRYKQYRPDVIICDDIEDLASTRTMESRDKIFNWFSSKIIPLGTPETKIFVLGNFLHEHSMVGWLMTQIKEGFRTGIARKYPLIDERGVCLWPGRYPDAKSIENLKKKVGDPATWNREYLLKIIAREDQVVQQSWIKYYDNLPDERITDVTFFRVATGIDLAISQTQTADYTAMVSARAYWVKGKFYIYVLPDPINLEIDSPTTMRVAKEVSQRVGKGQRTALYIEDVAYQKSFIQNLRNIEGYPAEGVPTQGQDKRARLMSIVPSIENTTILFPRHGAEILVDQLIDFGGRGHDDLVDAFVIVTGKLLENNHGRPSGHIICGGSPRRTQIDRDLGDSVSSIGLMDKLF